MNRFRNILVYPAGLHESDPAIQTATDLARRTGAALTVATVTSPKGQFADIRRRKRRARLHSLTSQLRRSGIAVQTYLLASCSPQAVLVEHVRAHQIDLVVQGGARRGTKRDAFSSIAKELMRTCPCPVWTVRSRSDDDNPVIVAAVAPYHHDDEAERLDRDVLDVAVQLAALRHARLHIASVWTPFGAGVINRGVTQTEYQDYARSSELAARRRLLAFLAPYDLSRERIHIREGRPGEMISAIASHVDAEVVVVGSAGRTGIKRWIFGNTVETVLDDSAAAVLGVALAPTV